MKVVAIVGSVREESYNNKLAKFVQKRYANKFDLEILDLSVLPLYNQDIEENEQQAVVDFKLKVKDADAVFWVTPEYNATVPGVLVNAIEWLSRIDKSNDWQTIMDYGCFNWYVRNCKSSSSFA